MEIFWLAAGVVLIGFVVADLIRTREYRKEMKLYEEINRIEDKITDEFLGN